MKQVRIEDYFPMINEEKLESDEEKYFVWWLIDLKIAGFVNNALHEPTTFELSDPLVKEWKTEVQMKTKLKVLKGTEEVLPGLVYTPDFAVEWTEKAIGIFCTEVNVEDKITYKSIPIMEIVRKVGNYYWSYVEVKPIFDKNNMTRAAKIKMNWTYQKHDTFINLHRVGDAFFKKTFTPERYNWTNKNGTRRKINYKSRSLAEFISTLQQ